MLPFLKIKSLNRNSFKIRGTLLLSIVLLLSSCASGPLFEGGASEQRTAAIPKNWPVEALQAFNKGVAELGDDNESARIGFSEAIQLAPAMEAAYFNLVKLELNDNNFDGAENISNLAQQNNVRSARLSNLLATGKRQQGDFDAAKTLYLQALQLNKTYIPAMLNLAILYDVYLGDIQTAEKYYLDYQSGLSTQGKEDNRLKNWLTDLRRRISQQNGATQ